MRFKTLEIRWHDSKPISTCDYQPVSFKKARPPAGQEKNYASQSYRLATGGEDNHVRIWMVYPLLRPSVLLEDADVVAAASVPRQPRVEYLATLGRHSAPVNVVRFSPNGELIASAGDDGMIIVWAPTTTAPTPTYGTDIEDLQHEKEFWKPRTTFKCTDMQVYDLAWSPNGEYILAGSTDNVARVFASTDGKLIHHFADHKHYVQGVAWDPLNEYIATQSSDRSMHIYRISTQSGALEVFPHRHDKMSIRHSHSRTPSTQAGPSGSNSASVAAPRPRMQRRESTTSDLESTSALTIDIDDTLSVTSGKEGAPLTPATSVSSTPFMGPPLPVEATSRRSSFSSNAPNSPSISIANSSRYGRSPSPIPPLPAIRSPSTAATAALWAQVKLYGDENHTTFFRRLTFSPDGGLLLTPAGQFEDPFANIKSIGSDDTNQTRGRQGHPSDSIGSKTSSVYVYSRANFARAPVAQLPGHKKATVAVRFSPVLYELRPGVTLPYDGETKGKSDSTPIGVMEKGVDGAVDVDISGPLASTEQSQPVEPSSFLLTPQKTPIQPPIATPTPRSAASISRIVQSSPALSPMDLRPPTPAASKPSTPVPHHAHSHSHSHSYSHSTTPAAQSTGSVFSLPYRLLYAVVTTDTVTIYDTQQAGPVCMLTNLHYGEFTDMSWSPDGQCLILSSRDGYCTLVMFDDILPAYHIQQHSLQLQSIAQHHSLPLTAATPSHAPSTSAQATPAATPASANINLPAVSTTPISMGATPTSTPAQHPINPKKRPDPPLTPAASVDGSEGHSSSSLIGPDQLPPSGPDETVKTTEPPKKKRRVALTQLGSSDTQS